MKSELKALSSELKALLIDIVGADNFIDRLIDRCALVQERSGLYGGGIHAIPAI